MLLYCDFKWIRCFLFEFNSIRFPFIRFLISRLLDWLEQIKGHAPESTVVLLVGNKIDDVSRRQVDTKEASDFAAKLGLRYMETSAKDGTNVAKAFNDLASQILEAA